MCIADGGGFSTRVLLLYRQNHSENVAKKRRAEETRIRHWFNRVVFLLCLLLLICNGKEIGIWVKFICFMPFKSGEKQNETESNAATSVWISFCAFFVVCSSGSKFIFMNAPLSIQLDRTRGCSLVHRLLWPPHRCQVLNFLLRQ